MQTRAIEQRFQLEQRHANTPNNGNYTLRSLADTDKLVMLQGEYKDNLEAARDLKSAAESEKRSLTDTELDKLDAALSRAKELREEIDGLYTESGSFHPGRHTPAAGPGYSLRTDSGVAGGTLNFRSLFPELADSSSSFRTFSDYWQALTSGRHDPRLVEQRVHTAGMKAQGGYAVPTQYVAEILNAVLQTSIILRRARVIPLTSLRVEQPAWDDLNQSDGAYYGGFKPEWLGEDEESEGEQDATLRQIVLEAKKLALYTSLTRELAFASDPNMEHQLKDALRRSISLAMDQAFLLGDGNKQPKGIATDGNPALVTVNRAAANGVTYSDFASMLGRLHASAMDGAIWIMNPSVLPQLLEMKDDSGGLVWQPNSRDARPTSLFGMPIEWFDRLPDLGAKGDVLLVNPRFYVAAVAPDIWLDTSQSVHWGRDRTALRAVTLADGVGSWNAPYTPPAGATRSWSVALDMPSG